MMSCLSAQGRSKRLPHCNLCLKTSPLRHLDSRSAAASMTNFAIVFTLETLHHLRQTLLIRSGLAWPNQTIAAHALLSRPAAAGFHTPTCGTAKSSRNPKICSCGIEKRFRGTSTLSTEWAEAGNLLVWRWPPSGVCSSFPAGSKLLEARCHPRPLEGPSPSDKRLF